MTGQSARFKAGNEYVTPEEVAEVLRINVLTVYRYIRQGNLGAIRIGRNYRISRKDLVEFIESRRVGKFVN